MNRWSEKKSPESVGRAWADAVWGKYSKLRPEKWSTHIFGIDIVVEAERNGIPRERAGEIRVAAEKRWAELHAQAKGTLMLPDHQGAEEYIARKLAEEFWRYGKGKASIDEILEREDFDADVQHIWRSAGITDMAPLRREIRTHYERLRRGDWH